MTIQRVRYREANGHVPGGISRCSLIPTSPGTLRQSSYTRNVLNSYQAPMVLGYRWQEYIDDRVTQKGEQRHYNDVFHEQTRAAIVESLQGWDMSNYSGLPDLYVSDRDITVSYNPSFGGLQPPQWASLMQKLSAKLNGSVSHGSLIAVTAIEAGKTIRMIRNPFNLLRADWRKIAHNFSASSLARGSANIWLEGYYGWNAAYRDIETASKTVSSLGLTSNHPPADMEERFSASQVEKDSGGETIYRGGDGPSLWPSWSDASIYRNVSDPYPQGKVRVRVDSRQITYGVTCRQLSAVAKRWNRSQRFLNAWGLDTSSILDVLWEITPFSFVIDWFVDPLGLWKLPTSYARLNQLDVSNLGYSTKMLAQYTAQAILPSGYPWNGSPWGYRNPRGRLTSFTRSSPGIYSKYTRTTGLPDWTTLLTSLTGSGLSAFKTISGTALGVQRLLQRHR